MYLFHRLLFTSSHISICCPQILNSYSASCEIIPIVRIWIIHPKLKTSKMPTQPSIAITPESTRKRSIQKVLIPDIIKRTKETYEWTIQEFSNLSKEPGESIQSSIFSAGRDNKDKWYLDLFPGGRDKECRDYFSLYLMLNAAKKTEVLLHFQLSIIKVSSNEKIGTKGVQRKFVCGMSVGWRNFIKREDILDHTEDFLVNDSLKICCDFDYEMTTEEGTSGLAIKDFSVAKDLWLCFEQSKFSDCVIIVTDQKFHSHKMVLGARSSVFSAMIEEQSKQKGSEETLRLQIDDLEPEIVRRMLRFIYTGNVSHVDVMTEELLAAADKFNLAELRKICEVALFEKLSVRNAADILIRAHQFNAKELKLEAISFINAHLAEVVETSGYKALEKSHTELLRDLVRAQVTAPKVKALIKAEIV